MLILDETGVEKDTGYGWICMRANEHRLQAPHRIGTAPKAGNAALDPACYQAHGL
jgi:hypothetical protein